VLRPLQIGIVYETHGTYARRAGDPADHAAEYEPVGTIEALEAAIETIGHCAHRLGSPFALLSALGKGELPPIDAALSIAEGYGSRNREAWAPVLLEMAGAPLLGSDALTLSTSLDKLWTLERVRAAGVPTAEFCEVDGVRALGAASLPGFPVFVKPRHEGTAKGIGVASRCDDEAALRRAVARVCRDYDQPALVESFLPGAEYTVTVVGHAPPRVLPVLQRALEARTGIGLHALERHGAPPPPPGGWRHRTPGRLDDALERGLAQLSLRVFETMQCRDFARIDFKLDAKGNPRFLEINPLPTFAPDGSFGVLAELSGVSHAELVGGVIAEGLIRLGLVPATAGASSGSA